MRRVALVPGAARGIGAATVMAVAGPGWAVLAVDLAADDPSLPFPMGSASDVAAVVLDAVVRDAGSRAGMIVAHVADVRDPEAMRGAVAEAEARWGGLDAAVAAAGVTRGGAPLSGVPEEQEKPVAGVGLGSRISL